MREENALPPQRHPLRHPGRRQRVGRPEVPGRTRRRWRSRLRSDGRRVRHVLSVNQRPELEAVARRVPVACTRGGVLAAYRAGAVWPSVVQNVASGGQSSTFVVCRPPAPAARPRPRTGRPTGSRRRTRPAPAARSAPRAGSRPLDASGSGCACAPPVSAASSTPRPPGSSGYRPGTARTRCSTRSSGKWSAPGAGQLGSSSP